MEVVNQALLVELKQRLEVAKGNWAAVVLHILCMYKTTPHSTINENHFCLTYGTEVFIPVEVEELSCKTARPIIEGDNNWGLKEDIDFLDKRRGLPHGNPNPRTSTKN